MPLDRCWIIGLVFAVGICHSAERQWRVVKRIPHDPAYTQGLLFYRGFFYESTGLYGQSSLRRLDSETGEVLQQVDLPQAFFGEGLALFQDFLIQLTWRERTAIVYERQSFEPVARFGYRTEGWGLTHDDHHLIMSDGSERLYFRDPETFKIGKIVTVKENDQAVRWLNELEYIDGEVWANVYQTDDIVVIDPGTGRVRKRINFAGLVAEDERNGEEDVLNGIAYDAEGRRLFITGKRYSYIYQIEGL